MHSNTESPSSPEVPVAGSLVRVGGWLGMVASMLGLIILTAGCFGFTAAMKFAVLPVIFGAPGVVLAVIGGFRENGRTEDTHVLGAIFAAFLGLVGGLLLMAFQYNWGMFMKPA